MTSTSQAQPNDLHAQRNRAQNVARSQSNRLRLRISIFQIGIVGTFLAAWEVGTRIPWFAEHSFIDPFFISRPSLIGARVVEYLGFGPAAIWPFLFSTLLATLIGLLVGAVSGFLVGLALAQSQFMAKVFNPIIVALNSMPRIAFVPLITLLFGFGIASKVVTAWFVVFFLLFFNTYKGSRGVQSELIDSCRILGASDTQILWRVRVPFGAAWTFAAMPNAVSFALVGVVLAEFVGGGTGMGYLLTSSLAALNATDMFAAIAILSLSGLILVYLVQAVERRVLHWSPEFLAGD